MKARFLFRAFKTRFRDQRAEVAALLGAIRPGETVVDVGANKGSYLLWLSRAVKHGQVFAFEPQPALADYLRQACRACSLRNVTVEAKAVSDATGEATLNIPGAGDSPGASLEAAVDKRESCRHVTVPVITLDAYFQDHTRRISALKVDVEGHELALFRGAQKLLERHGPLLVFESENRHLSQGSVMDVLTFLRRLGYDGHFIQGAKLRPLADFDPAVHQRQEGPRFWDEKDYCNNFIMRRA
jgi:FkbM family methyltransferase